MSTVEFLTRIQVFRFHIEGNIPISSPRIATAYSFRDPSCHDSLTEK